MNGRCPEFCVYIVECSDHTLYTGWTTDISRRLMQHNGKAQGAKYTRSRGPVILKYVEKHESRSAAMKREYEIKHLSREQKLMLIANQGVV